LYSDICKVGCDPGAHNARTKYCNFFDDPFHLITISLLVEKYDSLQ